MGKFISGLFLGALAIGLSIFTGSRTLDLLAWALPTGQQIYQWLGLCAFEGGMLFWSYYFVAGAKGTPQRAISVCMACFSIIAVSVCTIADLSLDAGQKGEIAALTGAQAQAVIIFVGIVIVVNVAAYLACHLLSVENMRNMREQEAEDKIYEAGLKAISGLAPSIAADAAPYLATEWANRTWQRIVPGVQHKTYYLPQQQPAAAIAAPAPAPAALAQTKSIDTPIKPSEKTSNQLYREYRRSQQRVLHQPSAVAQKRQAKRLERLRPVNKNIDTEREPETEKVAALPKAGSQGANSQTKNTQRPGSTTNKREKVTGATHAK